MFLSSIKEKYLIWAMKIIIAVILFLPFATYSRFYLPYVTYKNFLFRILVEIMVLLYIALVLKNSKYGISRHKIWIFLACFIGALTFSSIMAGGFSSSFWRTYERMDGLISLYHLFAFFMIALSILRESREWESFFHLSIFYSAVIAFIGLGQVLRINLLLGSSGGDRVSSTLGNPTYLAAYLLINILLCLYLLCRERGRSDLAMSAYGFVVVDIVLVALELIYGVGQKHTGLVQQIFSDARFWIPFLGVQALAFSYFLRIKNIKYYTYLSAALYGSFVFIFLAVMFFTQTRGAILGLILGGATAFALILSSRWVSVKIKIAGIIFAIIMGFGMAWVYANKDNPIVKQSAPLSRLASISLQDRTAETRLLAWGAGLKGIWEKPFFGWGAEGYYRVFGKYFPPQIFRQSDSNVWFDRPHNIFIQYAVEGGLIGVAFYILFLASLIFYLLRYQKNYPGIVLSSFIVAYIGQNLFVFDSINSSMPFFFTVGFILHLITRTRADESTRQKETWRMPQWANNHANSIVIATGIFVFFCIWFANIRPMRSNTEYLRLSRELNLEVRKETLDSLFEVVERSPYLGKIDMVTDFSERVKSYIVGEQFTNYVTNEVFLRVEKVMQNAVMMRPNDIRLLTLFMNYYFDTMPLDSKNADKILALRDKAISLSPTHAYIYLLTARSYMAKRDYVRGVQDFETAEKLSPGVLEAHWNLFAGYVTLHKLDKAEVELEKIYNIKELASDSYRSLARIYASQKYYEKSLEVLSRGLKAFPNSPDIYSAMADVYAKLGKNSDAKKAALKAVELDSSFEEEAKQFLKLLDEGKLLDSQARS